MKKAIGLVTALFALFLMVSPVLGVECGDAVPSDKSQLETYIQSCSDKIGSLQDQQKTLKSAIALLTSRINLTQAQIASTNVQIKQLQNDIKVLGGVITDLNETLDKLSAIYAARLRQAYRTRDTNFLDIFLTSHTFASFENKLRYLQIAQKHDQIILHELESSRINLDVQKSTKEQKQAEITALKAKLARDQTTLTDQRVAKDKLLADTRNSETKYQQLLSAAQAQLAAFSRFVTSQGGATILTNQTKQDGSWGYYYNQRDSLWGNQLIGLSDVRMADAGCLITSMAMIASHYNKSLKPGDIAGNNSPFFGNTAYMNMGTWSVNGVTMSRTRLTTNSNVRSYINSELDANRPAIVGIYGSVPEHFIVIKAKNGDGDYIMNDPFVENGVNISFISHYPLSAISTVDRVTVN